MTEQQPEREAVAGVTFSSLLMMFGTSGMAQLGAMPDPGSRRRSGWTSRASNTPSNSWRFSNRRPPGI
jgi:hypothetical protein